VRQECRTIQSAVNDGVIPRK